MKNLHQQRVLLCDIGFTGETLVIQQGEHQMHGTQS